MEPNKTALNGRSTRESLHKAALPQGTAYSTAYIMDSPAAPVLKPVKTPNGPNMQQMMSQTLNQIKKLTMACLVLGIITVTTTTLVGIGLATGVLTANQGVSMVSALLIGVLYAWVRQIGLILNIITLIKTLNAKQRYKISIKKPILATALNVLMLYLPYAILQILMSATNNKF